MNTTTNTRGVSEAMAEEGLSYFEKAGDAGDKAYVAAIRERIAALEAALSAEPAAQPEDSRCPPTYRREEAVKALIGMGWTWNGKAWSEPAAQGEAVAWAQFEEGQLVALAFKRSQEAGCTTPLYTAPPAQPAERGAEGWREKARRIVGQFDAAKDAPDLALMNYGGCAIELLRSLASPAPSPARGDGGEG